MTRTMCPVKLSVLKIWNKPEPSKPYHLCISVSCIWAQRGMLIKSSPSSLLHPVANRQPIIIQGATDKDLVGMCKCISKLQTFAPCNINRNQDFLTPSTNLNFMFLSINSMSRITFHQTISSVKPCPIEGHVCASLSLEQEDKVTSLTRSEEQSPAYTNTHFHGCHKNAVGLLP